MCLGIIGTPVTTKASRNGAYGCFRINLTVSGSTASAFSTMLNTDRARVDSVIANSITENTTSSAVNGCPS